MSRQRAEAPPPPWVPPPDCSPEAIRQRVARDITRESMSRIGRIAAWIRRDTDTYTREAYKAAWVAAPRSADTDGAAR